MVTARLRLGQLLVDARMIAQDALDKTLELQRADGRRLGTLLLEQGLINETQLTQILSHQLAVPWVSLLHIEFSRQLLNLVPHDVAERYCLVPIYVRHVRNQGETLYVAMDDPTNEEGMRECKAFSGLPVRAMIAPPSDIRNAIRVYYGARARSVPPPTPVPRRAPSEPAPPLDRGVDSRTAPVLRERRGSEFDTMPEPPTRSMPTSIPPPPPDDALPAIEATEVDEDEVAVFEEEVEAWEARPVRRKPSRVEPEEVHEARARPTLKVAPPPELVAASQPAAALLGAVLGRPVATRSPIEPSDDPPSEREVREIPAPPGRGRRRMVSLTLLDGTTITLPARGSKGAKSGGGGGGVSSGGVSSSGPSSGPSSTSVPASVPRAASRSEPPPPTEDTGLTARDLVSALRAVSHGADASEILGNNMRWEAMFAALLSLLLKKHLIADWEFVDELKKI